MTTAISDVVSALGIETVSNNGNQIKGFCPVHKDRTGHEDQHPSWYINASTGAWFCFSCQGRGSLSHLVEALGGDADGVAGLVMDVAARKARSFGQEAPEPDKPIQYVSERLFAKNPYPHRVALERRDLDIDTVKLLNIRWDREGLCYLLPIYDFGSCLLGWQEKSAGYFNNYPDDVKKSRSLFGYQAIGKGKRVVLVESQLDAARFWRYGIDAVAMMGSFISMVQVQALRDLDLDLLVIAMDNDRAGNGAAANAMEKFLTAGVPIGFFSYPDDTEGQDPGDLSKRDLVGGVERAKLSAPPKIAELRGKLKSRY